MGKTGGDAAVVPALSVPHSVACLRSLSRRGVRTIAVCEVDTPAFCSRFAHERLRTPAPEENVLEYRDALLWLSIRPDVRTILPMREEDIYVLSKYRSAFAEHIRTPWPPFETIRTAHDRLRLVEEARAAGVQVPETRLLEEAIDWDRERIVKSRYAMVTDDYVDLESADRCFSPNGIHYLPQGVDPDRNAILAEMGHEPIVQEYVPGEEYALWALYDRGEAVATCGKHQIRGDSYVGGTSVYRKTIRDPELEATGRALLDHLDWHGLASVQFKRDANTGTYKLLEVNPRVWASISCPVRAGLDFPYYYWLVADGSRSGIKSAVEEGGGTVKEGIGTHYVAGELKYLMSILREGNPFTEPPRFGDALWGVFSSCLADPGFDHLSVTDPCPFVRELTTTLHERLPRK